jgi:membrane-bound serine protease (ClpP class)
MKSVCGAAACVAFVATTGATAGTPSAASSTFLATIANPTVAYVLLVVGLYGLIVEAFHPGVFLPGIIGGICLLLGMYALQLLPVNYAGLALMALGAGFVIAEMVTPTIGALGVGGVVAFVIGSIVLFNTNVPGYAVNMGVIAAIALCAIVLLGAVVWLAMRARRTRRMNSDLQKMLGAGGEVLETSDVDGETWAQIYGERWQVKSDVPLPPGTRVRVVHRQGLVLWVVPE